MIQKECPVIQKEGVLTGVDFIFKPENIFFYVHCFNVIYLCRVVNSYSVNKAKILSKNKLDVLLKTFRRVRRKVTSFDGS